MRTSTRWLVPVTVAATLIGGVAVSSARAESVPDVPSSTPQKVLAAVAGTTVTALSGTVVTRTDLGLPSLDLDGLGGGSAPASATDLRDVATRFVTGKNTLRVWADGETRQRVQLIDQLGEYDVIRNGSQVWTYSSRDNAVGTLSLKPGSRQGPDPSSGPSSLTPAAMADKALAAVDPTTSVTLGTPLTVAGRAAYALTLTPKTAKTLVDRVVIAVDVEKNVPLQVEIFARGHAASAVQAGFTSVDYAQPPAERFTFTPPSNATVTPVEDTRHPAEGRAPRRTAGSEEPEVIGTGWEAIVRIPAGKATTGTEPPVPDGLIDQATTPVAGGRAVRSTLASLMITDGGEVLVGAVPVESLVEASRR
jgi:outer membrane lipoprotein-sorting protein